MGLFDKIKDLFTDEEEVYETKEIDVPEEEEKEDKLPTFMRNKIEKEEQEEKKKEQEREKEAREIAVQIENKPQLQEKVTTRKSLSFDFKDEDFVLGADVNTNVQAPSRVTRSNVQKIRREEKEENYVKEKIIEPTVKPYSKRQELDKPKKFKPTPVISPVYGVLDKNYNANEVVSKDEDSSAIQRASKKVDFESVRKKAYGTLNTELKDPICENCEYLKEVRVNKKIERLSEEDLLYNMTVDDDVKVIDKSNSNVIEVSDKSTNSNSLDSDIINALDNDKQENINVLDNVSNNYNTDTKEDLVDDDGMLLPNKDITIHEAIENYDDYGVNYEVPKRVTKEEDVKIVNHADSEVEADKVQFKEEKKEEKKDLELTDDLFNLIDSMYKERDD